ncbi:MAG TPA: VWA domain-containing protein [Vicinamibacterales bacterium]|jgi:VWFA-related protein|nr:VWA domain-containing protein [Vicinamibacterales bacterium]
MVRIRPWRRWLGALLSVALMTSGGAGLAQQPQPAPADDPPSIRIDAVVTDSQGRPILDLRPSDFELLDNGVTRPIESVQLRTLPKDAGPAADIRTQADEERAARQPGTRVFGFVLDEFHVNAGPSSDRARTAINEFIDQHLRPDDLAIVIKPLDSVAVIKFTRDRALLHGAVDAFAGRRGDYTPRTHFEELYIGRAPGAVAAARRQIVGAVLRELTMRLGELKADRGVIVLVSEGFQRDPTPSGRGARIPELDGVVRAANRYHLPIYTLNPSIATEDDRDSGERDRSVAMLQWLSTETGGRGIDGSAMVAGMARLKHDLEAYYAVSYRPSQSDGRFHPIALKAKRRDVVVHTAPGYWAPLPGEWRAALASTASTLSVSRRALRRSPLIDAWVGVVPDPGGRTEMVITWEPRVRGVTAPQVVAVKARTQSGTTLFDGRLGQVGSASSAPSDKARFEVKTGRVEIDMTIYDVGGRTLDTDIRDFDVLDLSRQKAGPVLFAPEVVRARTLRDFQTAVDNPDVAPSSVRTFARGDRLLIRVPAFDASGTAVQVTAKILNGWGQPMRDIDSLAGTRTGMSQFALPLSWLVPGEYQIELQCSNANGAVRQRITIRVTG